MALGAGAMSAMVGGVEVQRAREDFLAALHALVPGCLDALLTEMAMADPTLGTLAPSKALIRHVRGWQERYGLNAPWITEMALITIAEHVQGRASRESGFPWCPMPGGLEVAYGDASPLLSWPGMIDLATMGLWDPQTESRTTAKARILAALEAELDRQMDDLELVRLSKPANHRHLQWLVRYQVLGQSMKAIAAEEGKDRTTIRDGLRTAAELLEISLRTPGEGTGILA